MNRNEDPNIEDEALAASRRETMRRLAKLAAAAPMAALLFKPGAASASV